MDILNFSFSKGVIFYISFQKDKMWTLPKLNYSIIFLFISCVAIKLPLYLINLKLKFMKPKLKMSLLSIGLFMISQSAIVAQTVPTFSHIVVVIGENTSASRVFGNSSAPYINALATNGAKFTNSFALFHPSQPNYIALYSGSNQGVRGDGYIKTKYTTPNLGRELIDAGKTYATYSEDLPSVGYDGKSYGDYVRKHNPSANWMGTGQNRIPATTNQPFTAFPSNFNNLPSVSFVVPNLCSDGHDSCAPLNNSVLQYDRWIQTNLDAYKKWCLNNNSLLIVTYDEDDFTNSNKIATVFYGAHVATGVYSKSINHYNVLRTIEDAFGLSTHAGAAATSSPITNCWMANNRTAKNSEAENRTSTIEKNEDINLFPNPVDGNMFTVSGIENNTPYEIVNVTGQKIASGKLENKTISLNPIPKGIYFIQFVKKDKTISKSFIKN